MKGEKQIEMAGYAVLVIIVAGFILIGPIGVTDNTATSWSSNKTDNTFEPGGALVQNSPITYDGGNRGITTPADSIQKAGVCNGECAAIMDATFDFNTLTAEDTFIVEGYYRWQSSHGSNVFRVAFGGDSMTTKSHTTQTSARGTWDHTVISGDDIEIWFGWDFSNKNYVVVSGGPSEGGSPQKIKLDPHHNHAGTSDFTTASDPTHNSDDQWNPFKIAITGNQWNVYYKGSGTPTMSFTYDMHIKKVGLQLPSNYQWESVGNHFWYGKTWADDILAYRTGEQGRFDWNGQKPASVIPANRNHMEIWYDSAFGTDMSCDESTGSTTNCDRYWGLSSVDNGTFFDLKVEYTGGTGLDHRLTFDWRPRSEGTIVITFVNKEPRVEPLSWPDGVSVVSTGGAAPSVTNVEWSHGLFLQSEPISGVSIVTNKGIPSTFSFTATAISPKLLDLVEIDCDGIKQEFPQGGGLAAPTIDHTFTCTPNDYVIISGFDDQGISGVDQYVVREVEPTIAFSIDVNDEILVDDTYDVEITYTVRGHHSNVFLFYEVSKELEIVEADGDGSVSLDKSIDTSIDGRGVKYTDEFTVKGVKEGKYRITGRGSSSEGTDFEGSKTGEVRTARGAILDFFYQYGLVIAGIVAAIVLYFVFGVKLDSSEKDLARTAAMVTVISLTVIGLVIAFVPEGIRQTQAWIILGSAAVIVVGFVMREQTAIAAKDRGDKFTLGVMILGGLGIFIGILLPSFIKYAWVTLSMVFLLIGLAIAYVTKDSPSGQGTKVAAPVILIGIIGFIVSILLSDFGSASVAGASWWLS